MLHFEGYFQMCQLFSRQVTWGYLDMRAKVKNHLVSLIGIKHLDKIHPASRPTPEAFVVADQPWEKKK